jgi:uncharacterized membrane protein
MLKKGNKLYSILTGSCPKCHSESMYVNKNPFIVTQVFKMHERCSNCDTKYKIEPSFFYGAMYVSYGLSIVFSVVVFVISYLLIGSSLVNSFIAIVIAMIFLLPIIVRLARNIWINLFMKYDKKSAN